MRGARVCAIENEIQVEVSSRVSLAKRGREACGLAFCKVSSKSFEARMEVNRGCPKSDKLSNANVRNKATGEASMPSVAALARSIKLSPITGATASKQVSAASRQILAPAPKIVALRLQERRRTDVQANNN
jgi:hypothetical protein